jgi:predicted DCC family thiol-disulfide oxidoreductase YuxK
MNSNSKMPESVSPREGWILYDGGCGFCSRWARFWEGVIKRRGFAIKDLQSASEEGLLQVPSQNLLDDIRVLNASGEVISGANAYLYVARRIWWAWPFYAVLRLPGFNRLFSWGYRWFNRNRYRLSRHCPLPPKPFPSATVNHQGH